MATGNYADIHKRMDAIEEKNEWQFALMKDTIDNLEADIRAIQRNKETENCRGAKVIKWTMRICLLK